MKSGCILIALTLWIFCTLCSEAAENKEVSSARIKVNLEDALKSNDLKQLKKELLEMQQKIVLLELENKTLRREKERCFQEFIEINQKYQKQNESYLRLKLLLSGAVTGSGVRNPDGKEKKLLAMTDDISESGGELALYSVQFCEFVESLVKEAAIGKIGRAELQLKSDELRRRAGRFMAMNDRNIPQGSGGRCRILSVDRESNVVVLSVGSVHGAFNGLIYRSGKEPAVLKVVATRPFVAAALLIKGNIEDLSPGMEAVSEQIKQQK